MLISFGNAFCYSKYRFILPSLVSIAVNIMLILVLIGGNYSSGNIPFDFISIYFYSFLLHGIILFITLLLKYHSIKLSFHLSREQIKKIFHYSSYAFIANVLFLFISRVDYLFVKRYCSPADLGNYIQVSKIAQMFFILPSMVSTVIFPVIAGGFKGSMQSRIRKVSKILLLGYSFCCLVLAITGKWLFPALYGQSFISMYVPFLLLIPGILAISGLYPYTAYNSGNNRISINIKGSVLALALIIIGDILFIPPYGIKAAALISSAGYCVYHFYVVSVFKKESVSS
jgi:O-antigen/teichoic acid export membrane protein